jgi:hypothetical protein
MMDPGSAGLTRTTRVAIKHGSQGTREHDGHQVQRQAKGSGEEESWKGNRQEQGRGKLP